MSTQVHSTLAMEWHDDAPTHAQPYLEPVIVAWLREAGARRVLDVGCGNGALTAALARAGFQMTGIDASETGIGIASRRSAGPEFLRLDVEAPLPARFHSSFDAVVAAEVIEHLPTPGLLCARAVEALGPGGRLIVTTPYHGYLKNLAIALTGGFDRHWEPTRDGGHIKFFSRKTLTALLEAGGFHETRFARVGRVPPLAKSMIVEARSGR
jgi:2-polyprenyl-6-hydroxyphenyl methylase/3-demethylubiquinone-9 3-methyltransferase